MTRPAFRFSAEILLLRTSAELGIMQAVQKGTSPPEAVANSQITQAHLILVQTMPPASLVPSMRCPVATPALEILLGNAEPIVLFDPSWDHPMRRQDS